jgi:uncharacterized HAD superfamily protein
MGNRLPRLGFDVDGVFADFCTGFMSIINEKFGTSIKHDDWQSYWDPIEGKSDKPIFTQEQWDYAWATLIKTPYWWAHLPAYADVDFQKIEDQMATFKFNGYFITRRRDLQTKELGDSNALTRLFFENHGLVSYSAVISHLERNRIQALKEIAIDAYLDDWGEQWQLARDAGINAYLIDRPYNRDIDTPFRVKSVHEFIRCAVADYTLPTPNDKVASFASA